jgi:hypothetical protein
MIGFSKPEKTSLVFFAENSNGFTSFFLSSKKSRDVLCAKTGSFLGVGLICYFRSGVMLQAR